jgi:hypothetical protein
MTLDEAILFCVTKTYPKNIRLELTEKEYEQMANWLKELKQYRRKKYKENKQCRIV